MRYLFLALWLATAGMTPAAAQLSFGFSSGGVSIGINVPVYPRLVAIPGYPVYYAPDVGTNFFFYDGLYWVFQNGDWYASSWYNGPWRSVPPDAVPLYVLRVPVRYYRHPPTFFRGWAANAPPRWDEHWGHTWADHHRDWNHWDRGHVPSRAPLPSYQRQYSGNRYPHSDEQAREHARNYRYQPRDEVVRQHYQQRQAPQASQQRQAPQASQQRQAPQAHEQRQAPQAHEQRQAPQAHEQRAAQPQGQAQHERSGHPVEPGHNPSDNRRGSGPGDTGGG